MTEENNRGCGIILHDKLHSRILCYKRDDKSTIPFPDMLDLLGGHPEGEETSEVAIEREMAEELDDLRTNTPYKLTHYSLYEKYVDEWGTEQSIFSKEVDFGISDVRLNEGQYLVWLTYDEVREHVFAFGFNRVVEKFCKEQVQKVIV